MLVLIGNSPSSGSTLLADLLDSTPFSVCGNELNFWSNKFLYDFQSFQKNPSLFSNTAQLAVTSLFPHYKFLLEYGIEKKLWHKWIQDSENVPDFTSKFVNHVLRFRHKDPDGVVFEKTPENLNAIGEFLETFPSSYFINISRDPLYVYSSLKRRGFGSYVSAFTWLVDSATLSPYIDHHRYIQVSYEELVERPFHLVSEILLKITGRTISAEDIEENYKNNTHKRKKGKKLKSWQFKDYGIIENANAKIIDSKIIEEFSSVASYKITDAYAELYKIPSLSYQEAAAKFNYSLPNKTSEAFITKSFNDHRRLLTKGLRFRKNKWGSIKTHLVPVVEIEG